MWKNVESGIGEKERHASYASRLRWMANAKHVLSNLPRSDDSLLAAPQTGRGEKSRKQTDKRVLSFELCMIGTQQTPRALSDYK